MPKFNILYEDEAILAACKPAGLPMHANLDEKRENFVSLLARHLQARDGQSGYLGIHQRLDLGTSGVVIFARSPKANASLAEQFAQHSLVKRYLAITTAQGHLPHREWDYRCWLGDPLKRGGQVTWRNSCPIDPKIGNFKEAITHFRLLQRKSGLLFLEASLKTGRKHQIRAQLAKQKLPILGDLLYGGADRLVLHDICEPITHPMLHAFYLELLHPLTNQKMIFCAPLPDDFNRIMERAGVQQIDMLREGQK
jgi:23S rRNA pseudouridine1911/1915/1917 synthase